jgi:type IV pilus assembly protein PilC
MAVYTYTAKDLQGNRLSGTYRDVATVAALREDLAKVGYTLLTAAKAEQGAAEGTTGRRHGRVSQKEVVTFAYQFAGMYSAGLSVIQVLQALEDQSESPAFKAVLSDIRQNIETGSSLKKAFERHEKIFSAFFVGMVEAGEAGGKLAQSLETVAVYLEKRQDLRQKVKSAFVYPTVVAVVCMLVVTAMLMFVVPMFSKLYGKMHVALPGPTQFLVDLSALIRGGWFVLVPAIVGLVFAVRVAMQRPAVRARADDLKLRVPVFGKLNRLVVASRFSRTLSTLLSVGVPLIDALEVAQVVANNHRMSEITRELQHSVRTGNPIARSLRAHAIFPPVIVQMIDSGEQAGILPDMLQKGADFLDRDIDRMVASLLVKLEPALTLVMGLVIGGILMGVYLPMFDYMGHVK